MLTVEIKINGKLVAGYTAVRVAPLGDIKDPHRTCIYSNGKGRTIKHRYGDGAEELARKLLTPEDDQ